VIPGAIITERDWENNIPAEVVLLENQIIPLYLNYDSTVKNLVIFDSTDNILLDIDLTQYNRCNLNSICDENENKIFCLEDCFNTEKDGVCNNIQDGTCDIDPDCENKDPDCIIQEHENNINEIQKQEIEEPKVVEDKSSTPTTPTNNNLPVKLTLFSVIIILIILVIIYILKRKN